MHKCPVCCKAYFPLTRRPNVCSRACKLELQARDKLCCVCGKAFAGSPNSKYCSKECNRSHWRRKATCPTCGKEFWRSNNTQQWCTDQCRLDYYPTGFYVYGLYVHRGTLLYIGKGCYERAYRRGSRPREVEDMRSHPTFMVVLFHVDLNEDEALQLEAEHIIELKPRYNTLKV